MNNGKPLCLVAAGLFFSALVFAQTPAVESSTGLDDEGKAITAVLPLAGEETVMALRFYQETLAAVVALEKYSPRPVDVSVFSGPGLEIPTDMPPRRDLVPGVRYALTGGVYAGARAGEYYLQLWLWEMAGSTMIYTDDLVYEDIDEAMLSLPGLVEWLFSHIRERVIEPPKPPPPDPFFVLGFRFGPSQRWYTAPNEETPGAWALDLEGGVSGAFRLNSLLALQGEVLFTSDTIVYRGLDPGPTPDVYIMPNKTHTAFSMMFPLLFRVNLRPGPFKVSPLAGFYAALPLGKALYQRRPDGGESSYNWSFSVPLGFTLGIEAALNKGPGAVFLGLRYAVDFGEIKIEDGDNTTIRRNMLSLYLGYEFGFFDRNK
ncbi:MAG: PorT family protein [Treponema sp.]|jgi:hypothetical protein|nr:PorT family protein [Treponema sp.]